MEGKNINKNEFYNKFSVRETRNSGKCGYCGKELPAGSKVIQIKDNSNRHCSLACYRYFKGMEE